jgi:hypothetical protein
MSSLDTSSAIRRRPFLRGVAGTVGFTLAGTETATAAEPSYSPLGSINIEGAKEAVVGENNTVYVAATDGFAIVDVSDPTSPSIIAEQRDILADVEGGPLKSIADVKIDGDRLLVAGPAYPDSRESYFGAVAVYDVSDPSDPALLRWKETEMFHHNVFIRDGIAYLTGNGVQGHPLVMLNVETLEERGQWSLTDTAPKWKEVPSSLWQLHDVWVQDGVAYPSYWDAGTWMVDVSDPTQPTPITKVRGRPPSALTDLTRSEEKKMNTELFEPPGNDHTPTVNDDATLLGIGRESGDVPPEDPQAGPGGIELFDISQASQPTSLSRIDPPTVPESDHWTTAHNFEIVGDRLYASWYAGGVGLFNVSDPSDPTEIRSWRDPKTTSFWTAQAVRPGEFFIASSWVDPSTDTVSVGKKKGARLYTFPEPALEAKRETTTQQPTPTSTATQQSTSTRQTTDSGSIDTTPTPTEASGPGFGLTGALVACSIGAWQYFRKKR